MNAGDDGARHESLCEVKAARARMRRAARVNRWRSFGGYPPCETPWPVSAAMVCAKRWFYLMYLSQFQ
ncbi:hypothetical protein BURPS305_5508 [Burkholderia pseudomallei 305]|nr:hypothetical protein BURPS305_5508 [Burkholderia pseudomallei 305]